MKNKKYIARIACQVLIAIFLVSNIVIAATTKEITLFSYICCHVLGVLQSVLIIDMLRGENSK